MLECKNPDAPLVKLWGLERSFTNWLFWSLSDNMDVTVLSNLGGWKHMVPPVFTPNDCKWGPQTPTPKTHPNATIWPVLQEALRGQRPVHHVFCVKEPLPWVASYCAYRGAGKDRKLLAQSWNDAVRHYLARHNAGQGLVVSYRSLLTAFDAGLDRIAMHAGLKALSTPYRRRERSMSRGGDGTTSEQAETRKKFHPTRYTLDSGWKKFLTLDEQAAFMEHIDVRLLAELERIDPVPPERVFDNGWGN